MRGTRRPRPGLRAFILLLCALAIPVTDACRGREDSAAAGGKLRIVCTIFPLYDFARQVGGDRVSVSMLLPPGVEPHAFEPRPGDIARLRDAGIFIYSGSVMEPWGEQMLSGLGRKDLLVIDASRDVVLRDAHGDKHAGSGHPDAEKGAGTARGGHAPGEGDAHAGQDPHYWLDFDNAARIVDGIARGLAERDPANGGFYRDNAASYRQRLLEIDRKYRESLAPCRKKAIAHGGHFAFGYLAHRYGLEYYTAYAGFTADAEPSPRDLMRLAEAVRRNGLTAIYQEELVRPAIAETVSRETGAVVLTLHPAANVSRADLEKGVTFLDLMELNLANLRRGLSCP